MKRKQDKANKTTDNGNKTKITNKENETSNNDNITKQLTMKTKRNNKQWKQNKTKITSQADCKYKLRSKNRHEIKQKQQIVPIIYTCTWLKTIRMPQNGREMISIQQQQHRKTTTT